jgi:hypothetical protein
VKENRLHPELVDAGRLRPRLRLLLPHPPQYVLTLFVLGGGSLEKGDKV